MGAGKRNQEEVEKEMGERLRYLKERLVPRCWIAFSGVVGDNQYAALGLMLVGTLGRLGRVVGWEGEGEVVDVKVDVSKVQEMGRREGEDVHAGEEDLGVPLLREEVMQTEEAQTKEDEKKDMRSESEAVSAETEKLPAKKKRKKKHHDPIDELFSSLI
jgi:ribonuclease MRP protein subunit RMP1